MSAIIDGTSGPYSTGASGNYGRNAAHNSLKLSERPTKADLLRTLRFTPPNTLNAKAPHANDFYDNLFGFTEVVTQKYDRDGNNALNLHEFKEMIRGVMDAVIASYGLLGGFLKPLVQQASGPQIEKIFHAQDRNQDGQLDIVEGAANTLFLDDPANLLDQKMIAEAHTDSRKRFAQSQAQALKQNFPSRADGQITDSERNCAIKEGYLNNTPLTEKILDDLIRDHDLRARYQAFTGKNQTP